MTGRHLHQASPTRPTWWSRAGEPSTRCPWRERRSSRSNYGTGYSQFAANLRLSKTFAFGKVSEGGNSGGWRRTSLWQGGIGRAGLSSMGTGGNLFNSSVTTNRRYNLTLSLSARNLFNNVNDAPPVGKFQFATLRKAQRAGGRLFFRDAANRRIDLQLRFNF